jgi:hypothetical protein
MVAGLIAVTLVALLVVFLDLYRSCPSGPAVPAGPFFLLDPHHRRRWRSLTQAAQVRLSVIDH